MLEFFFFKCVWGNVLVWLVFMIKQLGRYNVNCEIGFIYMLLVDFSDIDDEQSQILLGILQFDVEDELICRGVVLWVNSVWFDESVLYGVGFGGYVICYFNDFGFICLLSGMGGYQLEWIYFYKLDGRYSFVGYLVYFGIFGRVSSFGLDINFVIGGCDDDELFLDIFEFLFVFYVLGFVFFIICCWIMIDFMFEGLLYVVVCIGF